MYKQKKIVPYITWNEYLFIYLAIFITFLFVYFLPSVFSWIPVLILLIQYLFSNNKNDYIWIAVFFVFMIAPAGFFGETEGNLSKRLPLITITSDASLQVIDLFIFITLIKAIRKQVKYSFYFKKELIILLLYAGLLIFFAIFYHKTSIFSLADHLRVFFYFSLLYSIPVLFKYKYHNFFRIIKLTSPLIFIIFVGALYFLLSNGQYLYDTIIPNQALLGKASLALDKEVISGRFMFHGNEFAFTYLLLVIGLCFFSLKPKSYYWLLISVLSLIIIIISATRSWFVLGVIIFGVFFVINKKIFLKKIMVLLSILLLFAGILSSSQILQKGLNASWQRINTLFSLGQEESDATKTIQYKIQNRLPRALDRIQSRPYLGWGFTKKSGGSDVGVFGHIVQVGFIGFFLFALLWFKYYKILLKKKKLLSVYGYLREKKVIIILITGFSGLILSHFTTNQIFGYVNRPELVSLYLISSDFIVRIMDKNYIQDARIT